MKLSLLTYAFVASGLLGANANPLRVIFIDPPANNGPPTISNVASIDAPPRPWEVIHPAPAVPAGRQTCRTRLRQKAIAISNAFRQALGLPPIQVDATTAGKGGEGKFRIFPFISAPEGFIHVEIENGKEGMAPQGSGVFHHQRFMCRSGIKGFMIRLHRSLNALGPWEGKVVAFVLGCGIGVLLRMVWVLAVISYRSIRGGREPENTQTEYSIVLDQSDAEVIFVTPPSYVDADEKREHAN